MRDLVFRLFVALGLAGAIYYGATHPPDAKGRCTPDRHVSAAANSCFAGPLGADLTHWGVILAVGAAVGGGRRCARADDCEAQRG